MTASVYGTGGTSKICSNCGAENKAESRFCLSCGGQFAEPVPAATSGPGFQPSHGSTVVRGRKARRAAAGPDATVSAELVVETGPLAGRRLLLDRPIVAIGRADDNDIVLDDEMVSKNHCRIVVQGDNYLVEDLGSANGTVVNGETVQSGILVDGDKLFLGDTTLTFGKAAPGAAAAAAPRKWSRKKKVGVLVAVLGGLVLVAGAVLLVIFLWPKPDTVRPKIAIMTPKKNEDPRLFEMPLKDPLVVPITVEASDNKGLDRVEFFVNEKLANTTEAKKSRSALKKEEFTYSWQLPRSKMPVKKSFTVKVVAVDQAGNRKPTEVITVRVDESQHVARARYFHSYFKLLLERYVKDKKSIQAKVGEVNKAVSEAGKAPVDQAPAAYQRASSQIASAGFDFQNMSAAMSSLVNAPSSSSEPGIDYQKDTSNPPPPFDHAKDVFKQMVQYAASAAGSYADWAQYRSQWADMKSSLLQWEDYMRKHPESVNDPYTQQTVAEVRAKVNELDGKASQAKAAGDAAMGNAQNIAKALAEEYTNTLNTSLDSPPDFTSPAQ